jgi:hypothetical protein
VCFGTSRTIPGICSEFAIENDPFGGGVLDGYRIRIDGPFLEGYLFVGMHRAAPLRIPPGVAQRN